ncbi:MAG TPA: DUF2339 domain-containing protein [Acidiferrobacteraceae bacterium]|nr:DUF2339 domain-containing protein [Acidiferrobacteraceae bacterium]
MTYLLIIIGAFLGAIIAKLPGALFGGLMGLLFGQMLVLRSRVESLEKKLWDKVLQGKETGVEQGPSAEEQVTTPESASQALKAETPPGDRSPAVASPLKSQVDEDHGAAADQEDVAPAPTGPRSDDLDTLPMPRTDESRLRKWIVGYFTGGNIVVRVGIIVLFFGVSFLLKYAADHAAFPIELRLMAVSAGAITMLIIGWRLRDRLQGYALAIQGGGIGVLYLTVFSALRLYSLIPASLAFGIMLGLCVFSAAMALLMNAQSLAVISVAGGFLAPILTSTGGGSHVMLFGFYAILNLGILLIAWFKAWRVLNLVGFVFTFVIGSMWGYKYYRPEFFTTTEPFLVAFFLFYTFIAVLFASRQKPEFKGLVEGSLVFGTPLIAFGLQAPLIREFEYGLAWSALALAFFYLSLAWVLFKKSSPAMRTLTESFLALGVVFGTVAIPLALDGRWTSAAWALEGAAMIWIGIRQQRLLPRLFGILLQLGGGIIFFTTQLKLQDTIPVWNGVYIGCLVVAVAGLLSGWYLNRRRDDIRPDECGLHILLGVWGLLWWFGSGLHEIYQHAVGIYRPSVSLIFIGLSLILFEVIGRRVHWQVLRIPTRAYIFVLLLLALSWPVRFDHLFINGGIFAWPLAFAIQYWILRRYDNDELSQVMRFQHASTWWLLALLGAWESHWWIQHWVQGPGAWPLMAWSVIPGVLLLLIQRFRTSRVWPLGQHQDVYMGLVALPLVVYLYLWSVFSNLFSQGNPWPLSYLPILNPLDLAQIFIFLVMVRWVIALPKVKGVGVMSVSPQRLYSLLLGVVFLWFNAVLIRTLHYWGDVPFSYNAMAQSVLVQTSLSIFWSLIALCCMFFATRKQLRIAWMGGAGLLGVVVIKLFTVDLSNSGTVERIVSFIVVGLLLLVIGYLTPVPPREQQGVQT